MFKAIHLSLLLIIFGASQKGNARRNEVAQNLSQNPNKLLIIVIDGFRWDYLKRFDSRSRKGFPGFDQFAREGVKTQYLESVFPAESFPSWQTINTGLYPSSHGIIGNTFFEPVNQGNVHQGRDQHQRGKFFDHGDERLTEDFIWWSRNEPIWATAQKNGLKFVTLLWGRCDISWFGAKTISPAYCESVYQKDDSKTLNILVDMALIHFQQGKDAALVYDDSLGKAGEDFGPLSTEVEAKLRELDRNIQILMARLREVNMEENVNVIIMSDHGMTYGSNPIYSSHPPNFPSQAINVNKINLGKLLKSEGNRIKMVVGSGAYAMVYPTNLMYTDSIIQSIRRQVDNSVKVYRRNEIPEHLHFVNDMNTPPILILASPGTVLLKAGRNLQRPPWQERINAYETMRILEQTKMGLSGYDPKYDDMKGIFMAKGPDFRNDGETYEAIELVDVYQLFCHLLSINPLPNDGVWERIRSMLRNESSSTRLPSLLFVTFLASMTSAFS